MKSILYNFTPEEMQHLLNTSDSYSDLLRKVGLNSKGGNPETLKRIIKEYQLDETQLNINRIKVFSNNALKTQDSIQIPIEQVFNNECRMRSSRLLKRLVNEGYKEYRCERCGISNWMNKPLQLQLHHKDGNHDNNALNNLEILCPNCHTQTDNYGGKASQDSGKIQRKKHNVYQIKRQIELKEKRQQEYQRKKEEFINNPPVPEGVSVKPLIYKDIDLSEQYLITSNGEILSLKTFKPLKKQISESGYHCMCISCGSHKDRKVVIVPIAVAFNFVDGYQEGYKVRHKDGNNLNDDASNLEWVSQSEIAKQANLGGCINPKKSRCIETEDIFNSLAEAERWAGLSGSGGSLKEYLKKNSTRKSAGKHPVTGEKLTWELIDEGEVV